MKRFYPLLFIFLLPAIPACNTNNGNKLETATHAAKNNCPAPGDKTAMYALALSVIGKHNNDKIWKAAYTFQCCLNFCTGLWQGRLRDTVQKGRYA
jgi:hypothetical protein